MLDMLWFTQWGFLSLGALLLVVTLFIPPVFLLALSAGIAGFWHWLFPSASLEGQLILWVVLSIVFYLAYGHSRRHQHLADLRPKSLIGETFVLTRAIKKGRGKIKLNRALWYLQCDEDLPKKTRVCVKQTSGAILIIERCTDSES